VERILTETRTDPATLCLGITESVLVTDADAAAPTLHALKGLGEALIDEFGTDTRRSGR
jgi:EAL domain-containing protein (putative c-di-GMP-specific phosphodiesterase class I)